MEIVRLTEAEKDTYNNYVGSHPRGTFLQSWEWGNWQASHGKQVERFLLKLEGRTVGSAQVVVNSSLMGSYYYSAYGPLWDIGLSKEAGDAIITTLVSNLQKNSRAIFVRIEPVQAHDLKSIGGHKAESVQPPQTLVADISKLKENLLESFHHKTRYNIRVAEKHGVRIQKFEAPERRVIDLIMQTSERQKYRNHPRTYIEKLWQYFAVQDNSDLRIHGYLATQNDIPLASGLMVDFKSTRMYLFGGSDYKYRNLMAPYLLHWQAILDAQKLGVKHYDFGASENASGHAGSYTRFKMGFNPTIVNFAGTYDFPTHRGWYIIFAVLRKINRIVRHLSFSK